MPGAIAQPLRVPVSEPLLAVTGSTRATGTGLSTASVTAQLDQAGPDAPVSAVDAPNVTGLALINMGRQHFTQEQFSAAATTWTAAANRFAAQGDLASQALSLNYAALAHQHLGQWSTAEHAINKSLALLKMLTTIEPILWANTLNTQASLFLATGRPQEAIQTWDQARKFYRQSHDLEGDLGVQLNQAQAWQHLGFYRRARTLLTDVQNQLGSVQDVDLRIKGLHSLGITLQSLGELSDSQRTLAESLAIAQKQGSPANISAILLSLGNVVRDLSQFELALDYFQQAEQTASHPLDQLDARLNQLSLAVTHQRLRPARDLVATIAQQLAQAPPSRRTIYGSINFVESLLEWPTQTRPISSQKMEEILERALRVARWQHDGRAEAYIAVQQGKVFAQDDRMQLATSTTLQALTQAQRLQAEDITAQAAWQLGQLYVHQKQRRAAISAYQQAVASLQSLRGDLVSINADIQFSFRDRVEPVYRELVALLLEGPNPTQAEIKEARDLIEGLQLAELDNFFREACADLEPVNIDKIDPQAVVIYPIILEKRTAVIVSRPEQPLQLYFANRSEQQMLEAVNYTLEVLSIVYDDRERNAQTQKMYDWLIRPAEADGGLADAKTLVFVLDKSLRNIPMAVLHDGQQYLIEKYNVALSPGLQLLKPRPLSATKLKAVSAGLSASRQGYPPLPAVQTEIQQLAQTLKTSVLLDQTFTRAQLTKRLTESPASIVHLATHGQFSSNVEETFLLTWDGRLKLKEFSQLLAERDLKQTPELELLVLSACQTAAGDDRAVLGIAGFAVRSGARSTLATLWIVRDQSTAFFMNEFYQQLRQPGRTKAEALRQAQLAMIRDSNFADPFYWAPFVLVGSWL